MIRKCDTAHVVGNNTNQLKLRARRN